MNTVRKSLFSLIILTAVLLCAEVPRLQADVSAGSLIQNMNSTRQSEGTDHTA